MNWTVVSSNFGRRKIFLYSPETAKPPLGPTQPLIHWVPTSFPAVKRHSPPSSAKVDNECICTAAPPISFYEVDRENLTFYLHLILG
jgi:hypothetical protein